MRPSDPADTPADVVVLLAHGSPNPRHAEDIEALADRVRRRLPGREGEPVPRVTVAYLDHHPPTPSQALAEQDEPATTVAVLPLLLAPGYHLTNDVPQALRDLAAGRAGTPGSEPTVDTGAGPRGTWTRSGSDHDAPTLLPAPLLVDGPDWAAAMLAELATAAGVSPDTDRSVVLVTAGSTDPRVLRGWEATAARLTAETAWGQVAVAHVTVEGEQLPAVVGRLRDSATPPALVVPAVLTAGFLAGRIRDQARDSGLPVTGLVGQCDALVDHLVGIVDSRQSASSNGADVSSSSAGHRAR